jgi:hypothetical protein
VRVELPSGGWAEIRENLKGKDRVAAQNAVRLELDQDGVTTMAGAATERICEALLSRLITAWSFGIPPPAGNLNPADALEDLDLEDYNALIEAAMPLVEKVTPRPNHLRSRS